MREIADATVWLFGEAAGYVTGTVMVGEFTPISLSPVFGSCGIMWTTDGLLSFLLFSLSVIALSSFRESSIFFAFSSSSRKSDLASDSPP